jgi:phosphomannomutase
LLRALGVEQIVEMYCTPDGKFAHNPEPLPENLATVSMELKRVKADLGIVVDPDADRLAIINEDGTMFGEEYTLVAVADYVLQNKKGITVSNLSSTRTLKEITEKMGCQYHAAAVGEVNVVAKMKEVNAIIGGEGNGGIIYPELHYGRDALVGVALFLSYLAKFGKSCSALRQKYPNYYMYKGKIELSSQTDIDLILQRLRERYKNQPMSTIDGVRIEFNDDWIHLRKSNTEPIVRIYAESSSQVIAEAIVKQIHQEMRNFLPK